MLDHIDNQPLHERIAAVAPLLPGLLAESGDSPFRPDKIERILDRVYERLTQDASEPADPRLRELLADATARLDVSSPVYADDKIERILGRVRDRLAADVVKKPAARPAALLGLRSAALLLLRRVSVEMKLLSDKRRPFPDGPAEC